MDFDVSKFWAIYLLLIAFAVGFVAAYHAIEVWRDIQARPYKPRDEARPEPTESEAILRAEADELKEAA
jgi:hypothetical protein